MFQTRIKFQEKQAKISRFYFIIQTADFIRDFSGRFYDTQLRNYFRKVILKIRLNYMIPEMSTNAVGRLL